jgi:Kef-type K+ transport system membrane component KefB
MIVSSALLGRFAARKFHQPSVLGELIVGMFIGNIFTLLGYELIVILREGTAILDIPKLALAGLTWEEAACKVLGEEVGMEYLSILRGPEGGRYIQVAQAVDIFSRYGVVFLLYHVGLDTSLAQLKQVGSNSLRVAVIGVLAPFSLGYLASWLLLPGASYAEFMFIAATLGATSIGITARVLKDLHQTHSQEAQIVLGAAVMDDILGLIILSIVSGIVMTGSVEISSIARTIVLALMFIGGALLLGPYMIKFLIWLLCRLDILEAKLFISFIFVMALAWIANLVGLATIVGAFTAGLLMLDSQFKPCRRYHQDRYTIKELFAPLEAILAPIFFVLMGIQVKLESFFDWQVIGLAITLLAAAVIGKLVTGIVAGKGIKRWAIGLGMMPRGEVGLVFASVGKGLGVIETSTFSAIVLMVVITTMATPPLLKLSLGEANQDENSEVKT